MVGVWRSEVHCLDGCGPQSWSLPEEYLSNNKEFLSQVNSGAIQVMGEMGEVQLQERIAKSQTKRE